MQIDFSGSRPDGPVFDWSFFSNEYPNAAFTVFEDGVTGDCSTTISLNRLTASQVYDLEAFDLGSFEATCADKPVYEVIKAKDFNRCKTNPVYYNTNPTGYTCTLGTSACEQFMQVLFMTDYFYFFKIMLTFLSASSAIPCSSTSLAVKLRLS